MKGADTNVFLLAATIALSVALVVVATFLFRARRQLADLTRTSAATPSGEALSGATRAVKLVVETAARVRDQGVGRLVMSSLEDLTRWATEDRAELVRVAAPNGTVTILFTDIESSTTLNEKVGDAKWNRLLVAHDTLIRRHIGKHDGHVVKSQGDGFMVAFREPVAAMRAAIDIQRALAKGRIRQLRANEIRVRIGAHVGKAVSRGGDYFGRNVAMAARIAAQAGGGQILVSDDVHNALPDDEEFGCSPLHDVELKGLTGVHTLWEVSLPE